MQSDITERELAEIQASIHGLADNVELLKKGRRFMMKDELHRIKKSGQPAKYPYRVYLFNDMILFTERSYKKSGNYKYVTHMNIKDIFFIECMDSKEKYAFGIMHKDDKKRKLKFAAKDNFQRLTWKHTLEKQIEKYCPTDTTFAGGESMITFGSPRNSWNSSMISEFLIGSISSLAEFESDGSAHGDSPENETVLGKDDYSSNGSGDEGTYTEDTDEARSEGDGDESECECKEIQHRDGTTILTYANLHTILWWLINHCDNSDPILIKTFLHSCLKFTTAPILFQNLMQIFNLETPVPKVISLRYSLCDTRKRVAIFIRIWLEFFFNRDFYTNKSLFSELINFFGQLQKNNQQHDANVLKLVIIRVNRRKIADKGMNRFHALMPSQQNNSVPKLLSSNRSSQNNPLTLSTGYTQEPKFVDLNITAVAEQFVLVEFSLFRAVDIKEISNMAWKSENPRKTAPNVVNIFYRFNVVSQWAATEVVMAQSPKQRVFIIEKLIALAQKCLELRNYNSLMEIVAGLNRGSVQRMKKTWESVAHTSRETFYALKNVVDSYQNYKNYRDLVRKPISPCLPYFGIYLKDLISIEENPTKIGENIHFEKIYMISRILKEMQNFQSKPYPFEEDEVLTLWMRRFLSMDEEMLYKYSQTIEPSSLSASN